MAMDSETALLAAFALCLALPHMQEIDAVKMNNAASGFITDDQANQLLGSRLSTESATYSTCIQHGGRQEDS